MADCWIVPHPVGWVKPAAEVAITSGAELWPAATPDMHRLERSSVDARPAILRDAVNDVVAIKFLPKKTRFEHPRVLNSTRDSRLHFSMRLPGAASSSRQAYFLTPLLR